jgi:hypothetical protein
MPVLLSRPGGRRVRVWSRIIRGAGVVRVHCVTAKILAHFVVNKEIRNGIPCDDGYSMPGSIV